MSYQHVYYNKESTSQMLMKLAEVYFKANQNISFVGYCSSSFKDKYYRNTYEYIVKNTQKFGVEMNDTERFTFIYKQDMPNLELDWDRNTPVYLWDNRKYQRPKEFPDLFQEFDLKEYSIEEIKILIPKIYAICEEYLNALETMGTLVTPATVKIHSKYLNSYYKNITNLKIFPCKNFKLIFRTKDSHFFYWKYQEASLLVLYKDNIEQKTIYLNNFKELAY